MYREGIDIGALNPSAMKCTVPNFHPRSSIADSTIAYLFNLLYAPTSWSDHVNTEVFQIVTGILQTAVAHNITLSGGAKYNVPSGSGFSFDKTLLGAIGAAPPQNLTSYALAAISGADNFNDDSATIKDLFDAVVSNTRQVTSACKFHVTYSLIPICFTHAPPTKSERSGLLGTHKMMCFLRMRSDNDLSYVSYKWPTRTVERLPPYTSAQLKNPVLVIGNTVRPFPTPEPKHPVA